MGSLKRRPTRVANRIGVWMYRTLDGQLASGSTKVHVLMITTPGRRTGIPRSTCVRYLDTPEGFSSGAPARGRPATRTGSGTCAGRTWLPCRSGPGG
jgi:hypothetical protein